MGTHLTWLAGLPLVLASASGPGPADLPAADRLALLRVLCELPLHQDAGGWSCGGDNEEEDADPRTIRRWQASRRGRFVAHDDEWLVTLAGPCMGGCPGESHVVRKVGGSWTVLRTLAQRVDDTCLQLRGPDGLDRTVCQGAAGPHQGFMTQWLDVGAFGGAEPVLTTLLWREQGGECFLAPPAADAADDTLEALTPGVPGSGVAFTARLQIARARCDATRDEGQGPMESLASHELRFVYRRNQVVPDETTAAIIEKSGWKPDAR